MATHRGRLLASSVLVGAAAAALLAAPASAQETEVGELVVTGSRIVRPNLDAPTPVTVVDTRQIEATGSINTGDILRILPAAGVSTITPTNSGFQTASNGITTVDLRNLGEDRTLVLVNGRRFVSGVVGSQIVDFNVIPTDIVERIDVVTGGASAIYGSDALAGVINIITRKDFEGIIVNGQYGISDRGDDERAKVSITAGSRFADDKGSAMVSLSYSKVGAIYARDRDDQGMAVDALDDYTGDPADHHLIFSQTEGLFSSFTPIGTIEIARPGAGSLLRVFENGQLVPFSNAAHGFNRQAFRILSTPMEQINFAGAFNYEVTPAARFFTEINYTRSDLSSVIEPTGLGSDNVYGAVTFCEPTGCGNGVPITSAVVPEAVRAAARAANPGLTDDQIQVGFRRRLVEVGNRGNQIERSTFRVVTGFEGDLNEDHSYEISLNYGRTDDDQQSGGDVNILRFQQALDAVVENGQIVCRDVTARAAGCVPLNPFGLNSITPEAANFVRAPTSRDSSIEQFVINGFVRGNLWQLPAGPVGYAVGAEYREEKARDTPDALTLAGLTSGNATPETRGKFDVYELFGELRIPIASDLPFVDQLDLNLAGRWSDYSTVGTTKAWAASLEYQPVNWMKLRTQYARAVRAPNISELFQPASQDFPSVNDPCAGVTRVGNQAAFFNTRLDIDDPSAVLTSGVDPSTIGDPVATGCLADPAVAARVARDGGLAITQVEQQSVTGFDGGNPNLEAEKGNSFSVGLLINPPGDAWWSNFSLSIDYYMIKIKNRIALVPEDNLLSGCYGAAGGFDPASPFCRAVVRFASGPQVGALFAVNQISENVAETDTRGWDVQLSYRQDLNDLGFLDGLYGGDKGAFTASLQYSYLEKLQTIPFEGASEQEYIRDAGTVGAPTHEWTLDLVWQRGPLQLAWNVQYIGEAVITQSVNDFYYDVPLPSKTFHDAQVRYDVNDMATVYAGVDNIFDEYLFIGGNNGFIPLQSVGWTTWPEIYDGIGRRYYAGVRLRF